MKYIGAINKNTNYCDYITTSEEILEETIDYTYREVEGFSFTNRKYDIKNNQWLDEYYIPPKEELPPEPPTIESLEKEILSLKEQQKKDNLLLLRTILESVEEITAPAEGGK